MNTNITVSVEQHNAVVTGLATQFALQKRITEAKMARITDLETDNASLLRMYKQAAESVQTATVARSEQLAAQSRDHEDQLSVITSAARGNNFSFYAGEETPAYTDAVNAVQQVRNALNAAQDALEKPAARRPKRKR
jgi:hypothetical protein